MSSENVTGADNQQERLDSYIASYVDGEGSFMCFNPRTKGTTPLCSSCAESTLVERVIPYAVIDVGIRILRDHMPNTMSQENGEDMVRPAWRHAEPGRNDLAPDSQRIGGNKCVGPYPPRA